MCTTRNPARSVVEMYFNGLLRWAVLLLAGLGTLATAQNALEIIALRHRTAEQVLPALRPLMEPGATLTGQGTSLIVRTSPANLAELRRALAAIDRPLRRLTVLVRFDDALDAASRDASAGARVTNRGARVEVEARAGESRALERVDQRIQVLEGGRAHIFSGHSTPIFDGAAIQESASGFEVVPRIAGNHAIVELAQRRDTLDRSQGLSTTLSAPLGEWFEVGGALEQASRHERGIASQGTRQRAESRRVWLKVEELRP
jgi:hypothetical protein